ncbi:uncharacterized protein LOC141704643 [Apium graveolens]|uniref:uncharacterized protein LOC141704643 n=1 Tax=Apium graveolens TaxID=4045 RepID=UPI003D7AE00E
MDLNKTCPKDHYPLPSIDQLIDATAGYEVLSFLDAFSSYHQIAMNDEDVPKTVFITPKGTYAYIKMPFGLQNAGATFQRMVNKVFKEQIGRNMEAYVDDMIVKSLFQDHTEDLKECFETLRKNNMIINPKKCTFRVSSGKFLGYMDLSPDEQLIRIPGKWKLFIDGSVAGKKCGVGLILSNPEGFEICQAIRFDFPLTNNEAEYEALLAGMELARSLEAKHLRVFSDSMMVVKHFTGEYEQRDPRTKAYAAKVQDASLSFETFELNQIGRENNARADVLSRVASAETQNLTSSIYLIPPDRREVLKIKYRASNYTIINGRMYRRSVSQPLLQCLKIEEQRQALEAVHEGICGEHLAGRSLAFKILRQGFFWPILKADANNYAKRCVQCQLFATVPKQPPEEMTSVLSPIPFAVWAVDIVGILPKSTRQAKYCIIALDYMTKWVEARPLCHYRRSSIEVLLGTNYSPVRDSEGLHL